MTSTPTSTPASTPTSTPTTRPITMVFFRAAGTTYCLPLHVTRSVRTADDLMALPDPAPEIAGILPGDPPLTVVSPLLSTGNYVIVVEAESDDQAGQKRFGLLVDEVAGLERVDEADILPPPRGQERPLVNGTLHRDGHLVLLADVRALGSRL